MKSIHRGCKAGALQSQQKGFTIVELMIVLAIISVLALVALPVYVDYTIRSKVSEALVFLAEAKTSVSDVYYDRNEMPTNNKAAGLRDPNNYDAYDYISFLEVGSDPEPGTITVTLKLPGTTSDGKKLQLVPNAGVGEVGWNCRPTTVDGVETRRLPGSCRQ